MGKLGFPNSDLKYIWFCADITFSRSTLNLWPPYIEVKMVGVIKTGYRGERKTMFSHTSSLVWIQNLIRSRWQHYYKGFFFSKYSLNALFQRGMIHSKTRSQVFFEQPPAGCRSIFWRVIISKSFCSERFLFLRVIIPKGFLKEFLFWKVFIPKGSLFQNSE